MKTAVILCAQAIALVGALAWSVPSFTQDPMKPEGRTNVAQYCMPADSSEMQRFYCRLGGG